MFVFTLGFTSI